MGYPNRRSIERWRKEHGPRHCAALAALVEDCQLNVPVLKGLYIPETGEQEVNVPLQIGGWRSVPGTQIVIAIPFEGDPEFSEMQPQTFGTELPRAEVENGEIRLTYVRTDHDPEALKKDYERALSIIQQNLSSLEASARTFNSRLKELVTSVLQQRKQKLLDDAGMVAALGLPLKKREGMPVTYSVPINRRVPKIEQIKVEGAFKPEPALSQSDYEENPADHEKHGARDGAKPTRVCGHGRGNAALAFSGAAQRSL